MFVNKNAIKSDFGNISDKVGMSHIGWDLLWEFGNWAWEFLCFGSSNTAYKIGSKVFKWSNLNAPSTQSTQVGRIPFSHFLPLLAAVRSFHLRPRVRLQGPEPILSVAGPPTAGNAMQPDTLFLFP